MDFKDLGEFYVWADNKVIDLISELTDDHFKTKLKDNVMNIAELCEHIVIGYESFLHRSDKEFMKNFMEKIKKYSKTEILDHWKTVVKAFAKAIENTIGKTVELPVSSEKSLKLKKIQYVLIWTDHSSYHRGQLIMLIKAITGGEAINTDYYTYLTEKN